MTSNNKGKSPFKLILTGVLVFVLLLPVAPRVKSIWDLNHRIKELEVQKSELQSINHDLEQELRAASSLTTVEKIAREELGLVKPGESRIVEVLP